MKCIRCKSVMEAAAPRSITAQIKKEPVQFIMNAPACPNCGHVAILASDMRQYMQLAADAYRHRKGLLTMQAMEHVREQFGMTQTAFADYLRVGSATYKRWLSGEIQSDAYDVLVRLRTDLNCAKSSTAELMERLTTPSKGATASDVVTVKRKPSMPAASGQWFAVQGGAAA